MTDEKALVRNYFNSTGFERWRKIYGEDKVNRVQEAIRRGHQKTMTAILQRLDPVRGQTLCDAGCGLGSLSIPLAQRGAEVWATDISEQMIQAAQARWQAQGSPGKIHFSVAELETLEGRYDIVICVDVMIHYPLPQALGMIEHLSNLAQTRLIFTFAPKTVLLTLLKQVGGLFPGASKATRAYQHPEGEIVAHLNKLGWQVQDRVAIDEQFYFARLLDCTRLK